MSFSYEEIMLSCWNELPEARPTFTDLVDLINDIIKPLANYTDVINNV